MLPQLPRRPPPQIERLTRLFAVLALIPTMGLPGSALGGISSHATSTGCYSELQNGVLGAARTAGAPPVQVVPVLDRVSFEGGLYPSIKEGRTYTASQKISGRDPSGADASSVHSISGGLAPLKPAPQAQQADDFLRGTGEGDLSKGRFACQRVAELAARTDLAKQIRVRVTERATDRLRERGGQTEQDLEVIREELVSELLRDVRIIDKQIDEAAGTCRSTAVMPKSRVMPDAATIEGTPAKPSSPSLHPGP